MASAAKKGRGGSTAELIEWPLAFRFFDQIGRADDHVVLVVFPPDQGPCIHFPIEVMEDFKTMRPYLAEVKRALRNNPDHGLGVIVNPAGPRPKGWGRLPEQQTKRGKPKAWGASNAHISGCVAVFGECDGALSMEEQQELPLKVGLPPASFSVTTSNRSLHHYWLVKGERLRPNEFRTLNRRIARYLGKVEEAGADRSICNPSRVMRLPGSLHPKSGGRVEIYQNGGPHYTAAELLEAIKPLDEELAKPQLLEGEQKHEGWFGRLSLDQQRILAVEMVQKLPLRTQEGKGLYHPSQKTLAGMVHHFGAELAVEICLEAGWVDPEHWRVEEIAASITDHGDEAAGIGSLIHWARQNGWRHPDEEWEASLEEMIKKIGSTAGGGSVLNALEQEDAEELQRRFKELRDNISTKLDLKTVLPLQVAELLEETAEAMEVDPVGFVGPLLTAVASIAGTRAEVRVKKGWSEPLVLWLANLMPAGSMKSPIAAVVTKALQSMERDWREEWEQAKREQETFEAGDPNDPGLQQLPPARRAMVVDCTYEKLLAIHNQPNVDGLLSMRDELGGMFSQLERDPNLRANWLSLWSGGVGTVDRKVAESTYVPKTGVSLFGNLQPDRLETLLREEKGEQGQGGDGLWSRFLWCRPECRPWKFNRLEVDATPQVKELLVRVDRELGKGGLQLQVDLDLMEEHVAPMLEDFAVLAEKEGGTRAAFLQKLRGYYVRFMGVLTLLDFATAAEKKDSWQWLQTSEAELIEEFPSTYNVDLRVMLRAVTLTRFYLAQWDFTHEEVAPGAGIPKWVTTFLKKVGDKKLEKVSPRDLVSWKLRGIKTSRQALGALKELQEKWGYGEVQQGKRKDQFFWVPGEC
ncbi:DUF3987 domain-containing protein [Synechococcus sp. MIT S1220]|uniref:DUF3987 domain-containing protein n=1 Tax=Synechococcus sp. MIT S1220 TaxID=3082549 RepID=UPI0039B0B792